MRKFIDEQSKNEAIEQARRAVAKIKRFPISELTDDVIHYGNTVFCRDGEKWYSTPNYYNGFTDRAGKTKWSAYPFGFGTSRRLSDKAEIFLISEDQPNPHYYAAMIDFLEEMEAS